MEKDFRSLWRLRYGAEGPAAPELLAPFLSHRSIRDFASTPIPEDTVRGLFAAAQSAATSANLQLWSAVSVQEPERRKRIAELCASQKQIVDAAWFFAFVADHHRVRRAATAAGVEPAGLDFAEFFTMAVIDAALAAERMACAAEALGLGICYIGALRNDPAGVAELLKLSEGTFPLFGFCLGAIADAAKAPVKPRLSPEAIWFREEYNSAPDTAEYDRRMIPFYASQGMKGDVTWSMRSGRRVDGSSKMMTGREGQKSFLERQGFLKR